MKKLIAALLVLLATAAGAADFADIKGRDFGEGEKSSGFVAGQTTKHGFRIEASVKTSTYDAGQLGLELEAPLLSGKRISVRVLGGVSIDPFDYQSLRYKFGTETEYKVTARKSFILTITNRYDPFLKQFSIRPTIMAGGRFYF